MHSLMTKLTLAFLIVGLVGAVLVAVLVRQRTRTAFDEYILDREQALLVQRLQDFYALNGSWNGVDLYLRMAPGRPADQDEHDNRQSQNARRRLELFTVIAPDGRVVFGGRLDNLRGGPTTVTLSDAKPIEVDGETVGWLARQPIPEEWVRDLPETSFFKEVTQAAQISALVAIALALALGGVLAYGLTRSLRELKDAADDIARGNLGHQVQVRSRDELGDLALAFNRMSQDLQRATQARRQMTADIAHDLRTPLSVLAGYTEALSEGKLPGTSETYAVLHQETQYLSRLIEDLRLLSLADAGELSLNLQAVQPGVMLEQAVVRHAVAAQQKGVRLRSESQNAPAVQADPERLAQVLDNLITNAVRHTPQGGEVLLRDSLAQGEVWIQVQDSGAGIDPEDLPNIFNRFYRGDSSRTADGASGLGLAIAKSIIQVHGGSIQVESQPGLGATFTVRLPARPG